MRFRRFDGEYRWFRIAVSPVHDERGNLIRCRSGITTDIKELRSSARSVDPDGAAARMGLNRITLISRMKKLAINPYDYA